MKERLVLKDKTFVPYIRYEELEKAIDRVASEIENDYRDAHDIPILLCVLNGSVMFCAELMKRIEIPLEFTSVRLASYEGTTSTGVTRKVLGLTTAIKNRSVIVVEDIVDTGKTIADLHDLLIEAGAGEVKICTMLFKPDVYRRDLKLDYVGMAIENKFIVGFGLDYDHLGRNYRDIYILEE